jgi:hypothetical protein
MQANGDSFVCRKSMGLVWYLTLSDVVGKAIGMGRGILVGRGIRRDAKRLAWLMNRTQDDP